MKKFLQLLLLVFCIPSTFIQPQDRRSADIQLLFYCLSEKDSPQWYLEAYRAPKDLQDQINEQTEHGQKLIAEVAHRDRGRAFTIKNIYGFFFKPELDRIKGALLIKRVIQQEDYTLLFVPEKYAVGTNDDAWVAAQKVIDVCDQPFNKLQIQQLCGLIKKTYFIDTHSGNILPMADGRVAIIDTELGGFVSDKRYRIHGLFRMQQSLTMTPEAYAFLTQEIENEQHRNDCEAWILKEKLKIS